MLEITPARRAQLSHAGRIGGLTRSARVDTVQAARSAQRALRQTFLSGHRCKVCPPTEIPRSCTDKERQRRADALFQAHMLRIRRSA